MKYVNKPAKFRNTAIKLDNKRHTVLIKFEPTRYYFDLDTIYSL